MVLSLVLARGSHYFGGFVRTQLSFHFASFKLHVILQSFVVSLLCDRFELSATCISGFGK